MTHIYIYKRLENNNVVLSNVVLSLLPLLNGLSDDLNKKVTLNYLNINI